MSIQCQGCNGLYNATNPDGSLYFHACPPGTPANVARNENLPDTSESSHGKMVAAGAGVKPSAAVVQVPHRS